MPVYVIQESKSKRVKIGYTADSVNQRVSQLQTGNPEPLELVIVYPEYGRSEERFFHHLHKEYRLCGEWFAYQGSVRRMIANIRNQQNWDFLKNFMKPQDPREMAKDLGIIGGELAPTE